MKKQIRPLPSTLRIYPVRNSNLSTGQRNHFHVIHPAINPKYLSRMINLQQELFHTRADQMEKGSLGFLSLKKNEFIFLATITKIKQDFKMIN